MIPLLLALWFAPQEKPPEKATLSGTVVNSVTREPLARATVLAEPGPGSPAASTTTDDKGRFELVALEPGQYHLKARRNGYQETYYGARRVDSKGTAISLEPAQDAKHLEIRLLPYAVVAGTVDFAALFGGVYLVSQLIAGAFTGIAFLTFGSAAR